jgi:hypothetical protein
LRPSTNYKLSKMHRDEAAVWLSNIFTEDPTFGLTKHLANLLGPILVKLPHHMVLLKLRTHLRYSCQYQHATTLHQDTKCRHSASTQLFLIQGPVVHMNKCNSHGFAAVTGDCQLLHRRLYEQTLNGVAYKAHCWLQYIDNVFVICPMHKDAQYTATSNSPWMLRKKIMSPSLALIYTEESMSPLVTQF